MNFAVFYDDIMSRCKPGHFKYLIQFCSKRLPTVKVEIFFVFIDISTIIPSFSNESKNCWICNDINKKFYFKYIFRTIIHFDQKIILVPYFIPRYLNLLLFQPTGKYFIYDHSQHTKQKNFVILNMKHNRNEKKTIIFHHFNL